MKPNIELHIEALVLHGFAPADRDRIGRAVERELQRLFAEHGAPPRMVWADGAAHLDGGTFEVAHGTKAEMIGVQIAQTLHRRLS